MTPKKQYYICVTPFFPSPDNWRGAFVLDQVKAIQKNSNYEVIVMKPISFTSRAKDYVVDDIQVHLFPSLQTPSYLFNGIFNKYNSQLFLRAIKKLKIDLNCVRFIHTHTGPFAIYGLALQSVASHIKVFVQHHNLDTHTIRNGKFARWKPNAIFRAKNSIKLINSVDLNICISTPCKEDLLSFPESRKGEIYQSYIDALQTVKKLPHAHPKEVYVLYNGVNTSVFNNIPSVKKGQTDVSQTNIFRIGCIANFQELKDHKTLVKAFKTLVDKGYTNMRLSLLGSGETKEDIIRFLKDENLYDKVEWPLEVNHDNLKEYYQSLDIFVLPSYFEGFGCVYTEAYACGVPFICCKYQGISEYIAQEECGKWLIEPKDDKQLAYLIEQYFKERYTQILCKEYDIDILIKEFIKFIENKFAI